MSLELVCKYVDAVECSIASDPSVLNALVYGAILTSKTITSWHSAIINLLKYIYPQL